MKKSKSKVQSPSLFGEESIAHEPIKELKLKKVKVEPAAIEQTLFDIPALPVQTKRIKVKEVVKEIPIQDTNTPCYKLLFPFPHDKYGLLSTYNMSNPNTVKYYEKLKLELCQQEKK